MSYTCRESMSHDGWHFHACGKPAKTAFLREGEEKAKPYCGIHARRYRDNAKYREIALPVGDIKNKQ